MTEIMDGKRRSELMAGIRRRGAASQLTVHRVAHRMGSRFRLHRKELLGCPDLAFPKHQLAVFVLDCVRHPHEDFCCAYTPNSRALFWAEKLARNGVHEQAQ